MFKRIVSLILVFLFVINLGPLALAQAVNTAPSSDYFVGSAVDENAYKLGPGDQLEANIIVGNNALTIEQLLVIGPDGKVFFPKVGEFNLLELTISQAKQVILSKIKQIYKEQFSFSFRLVEPRGVQLYLSGSQNEPLYGSETKYVSIYGQVSRPGRYVYLPGKKFSDYISYAGGPLDNASLRGITITRQNQKISIDGKNVIFDGAREKDVEIIPGDVINVPKLFVYFSDLASFSSVLFTFLALYNTFLIK